MGLIDDLKAKADANGGGKIDKADLEALQGGEGENNGMLDKLKAIADQNDDGKLSLDDVKSFDLGSSMQDAKDSLFGK